MKDIETKDAPEVSGGYAPGDGGCLPPTVGYPQEPVWPLPGEIGPDPGFRAK